MKQDLIKDVILGMLPYLNNAQNEKLQEVLRYTLAKYEVTGNQNKEKYSEQNYIELFISAKRIEGCSEKSLKYYNVFMDYRNESQVTADIRWNDRITYDGTWENNLFNFFTKVTPKLTEDLKKPFKLEGGVQRIDDTPVHKAVREGFVNMIIHADYLMDAGVLKVIKKSDAFEFTNPGILKLPLEDIYRGGNSKSRNPHMQTMLRLVGFGDNAGSGFPTILEVWKSEGWKKPELIEDTNLDQVTLVMKMEKESDDESAEKSAESAEKSADSKKMKAIDLSERQKQILAYMDAGVEYSTEQVAEKIGLKGPRTRQLLNELVNMELLACIGTTKRRRYIKV